MAVIDGFQEQLTTSSNRPKSVTGPTHSDKEVPHSDRELPKVHLGSKVAQPQSRLDQAESDIEQQSADFNNELSVHDQIRQKAENEAMKQFKSVLGGRCEFLVTGGAPTGKAVKKFLRDTFDVYLSDGYGTTEVSSC